MEKRVLAIVTEQFGLDQAPKRTDRFVTDLKADSLDVVELVMAFEEEFRVEIPDQEAEKLVTVGDAITFLEKKTPAKAP